MVSAGEVHLPGRPRDIIGVKAPAITAQRQPPQKLSAASITGVHRFAFTTDRNDWLDA
jgi:hypothetical protein